MFESAKHIRAYWVEHLMKSWPVARFFIEMFSATITKRTSELYNKLLHNTFQAGHLRRTASSKADGRFVAPSTCTTFSPVVAGYETVCSKDHLPINLSSQNRWKRRQKQSRQLSNTVNGGDTL